MSKIAIHQPNYLPWPGYFYKIRQADVFVILDNVDYQSGNANSITNRVRIKGPGGPVILTVPVRSYPGRSRIADIEIDNNQAWSVKHLKSLFLYYKKAPYFPLFYDELAAVLKQPGESLSILNTALIRMICQWLGINTPILISGEIGLEETDRDKRIIETCKKLNADQYLAGQGSRKYHQEELFIENGIRLLFSPFTCPGYSQQFGEFIPGLSILDPLFNCGPEAVNQMLK
jgi:hypothetical protein